MLRTGFVISLIIHFTYIFLQTTAAAPSGYMLASNETLSSGSTSPIRVSLPPPNTLTATQTPISFPIPGTTFTLRFNHFGASVPFWDLLATLNNGRLAIEDKVRHNPSEAIDDDTFSFSAEGDNEVWVDISADARKGLTWRDLDIVLFGLLDWMGNGGREGRNRVTIFGISVRGRGDVGSGLVWSNAAAGLGVEKRRYEVVM